MFVLVNPKLGKIWSNTLTINKMIKVLFKSEEAAEWYLNNLTPKNGDYYAQVNMWNTLKLLLKQKCKESLIMVLHH